jgi:hypothetical protein
MTAWKNNRHHGMGYSGMLLMLTLTAHHQIEDLP